MDDNKNIQLGVGAVVFKDNAVLLVKRKNPPCKNQWAIPGGKVKFREPLRQAVEREILEETGIVIHAQEPVYTFEVIEEDVKNKTELHYVIIDFTAKFLSGEIFAADDAKEAAWVGKDRYYTLDINQETAKLLEKEFKFP